MRIFRAATDKLNEWRRDSLWSRIEKSITDGDVEKVVKYSKQYSCKLVLHKAIEHDKKGIVEAILENGFDVNECVLDKPLLHEACENGSLPIAQLAIQKGADVSAKDSYGDTALHHACESGSILLVALLIRVGLDLNQVNEDGWTPVHSACSSVNTSVDLIKFLEQNGGDFTTKTEDDKTCLDVCLIDEHPGVAALLREYGIGSVADKKRTIAELMADVSSMRRADKSIIAALRLAKDYGANKAFDVMIGALRPEKDYDACDAIACALAYVARDVFRKGKTGLADSSKYANELAFCLDLPTYLARCDIVEVLGLIGGPVAIEALLGVVESSDGVAVRATAALTLDKIGDSASKSATKKILQKDAELREFYRQRKQYAE